jgi:hypothetical protein
MFHARANKRTGAGAFLRLNQKPQEVDWKIQDFKTRLDNLATVAKPKIDA